MTFGYQFSVADLFGTKERAHLATRALPPSWDSSVKTALDLIDDMNEQIQDCDDALRMAAKNNPDL